MAIKVTTTTPPPTFVHPTRAATGDASSNVVHPEHRGAGIGGHSTEYRYSGIGGHSTKWRDMGIGKACVTRSGRGFIRWSRRRTPEKDPLSSDDRNTSTPTPAATAPSVTSATSMAT
ncbi:hypothetical protein GGI11_002178 [Coemansia sp. RSA 2049]|nr:hypothetical protein GGI11_002178 [Coemansia sp. RSA 2049]KAJ2604789.1 hypothetical protein EV177_006309 [Coemansia sp. RSA 1804]